MTRSSHAGTHPRYKSANSVSVEVTTDSY